MICCESYQSIPDDPRDNILGKDDFFDMFLTAWSKYHNVNNVSDEDYEVLLTWWDKFVYGMNEEPEYGYNWEISDMKEQLSEA